MPIVELATIVLKSPFDPSDAILSSLFQKLGAWQAECSQFPLLFFTNADAPTNIYLVTGWESEAAHMAWIAGSQNQELLRIFGPFIDMAKVSMVHLDIDFNVIPNDVEWIVVEHYGSEKEGVSGRDSREEVDGEEGNWAVLGRDLTPGSGGVYRLASKGNGRDQNRSELIKCLELERIYF